MRFARVWSFVICILTLAAHAARADTPATNPSSAAVKTVVITIAGEIDDYNRDQLFRKFDDAKKLGAKAVILNVDTYGGLLTSGLEISRFIKRQDDLHVVAYVQDKAISAGAMVAMACDEIVMSNSASLGDCADHLRPRRFGSHAGCRTGQGGGAGAIGFQ